MTIVFTLTLSPTRSSRSSRSSSARKASAVVLERNRDGLLEKAATLSGHFSAIVTNISTACSLALSRNGHSKGTLLYGGHRQ